MSIVARRFAATPVRTASDTWTAITNVIAKDSPDAKQQLDKINGVMASIISDETPAKNSITLIGSGPRLRVYCLYGEDAAGDGANESSLTWNPFEGQWNIYIPVEEADFNWVTKTLCDKGSMFKTYKAGEKLQVDTDDDESKSSDFSQLSINVNKLK
jgi:hypothetical protein